MNDEARFWAKVDIGEPDECWEWQAGTFSSGYGVFRMDGKNHRAHRLAFEFGGDAKLGRYFACHTCDNPLCCNPAHLFAGTASDNTWDAIKKGRHKGHTNMIPSRPGALSPRNHVGPELAAAILAERELGRNALARKHGIGRATVGRILHGKHWTTAKELKS